MRVRTVVASLVAGLLSLAVLGSCGHSARPAFSTSDQAAADEIAAGFLQSYGPLAGIGSDDAHCIAEHIVAAIGPPTSVDPAGPFPDAAERRAMSTANVDAFVACTDRWKLVFIRTRTEGADRIGDHSANCVSDVLDDEEARTMWITEMSGDYTDLHHLDPLLAAFDRCLTPEELDGLDWN